MKHKNKDFPSESGLAKSHLVIIIAITCATLAGISGLFVDYNALFTRFWLQSFHPETLEEVQHITAFWDFDPQNGSSFKSTQGNHQLVLSNAAIVEDKGGNNVLFFNGTSGAATTNIQLGKSKSWGLSFWIFPVATKKTGIVTLADAAHSETLNFAIQSGDVNKQNEFLVMYAGRSGELNLTPGKWQTVFISKSHEETLIRIYVDGVLKSKIDTKGTPEMTDAPLTLASFHGARHFSGYLDKLTYWQDRGFHPAMVSPHLSAAIQFHKEWQ